MNSSGIFTKKYANGYTIEVDFEKQIINYGEKIQSDSKTTQNFSQAENFVVLECVNRLLENGYKPENIVLEPYEKWDKQTKDYGVWENPSYDFKEKLFTKNDLKELTENESKKIFHEFASILRKHSVSDKPNAFNKIFNLFLAKLYDEAKGENDELEFHWRENDNPVDFQVRLVNLHRDGLLAFLEKEIEGIEDSDFKANSPEELLEKKKKVLKFNNILAIKEVLDDASFDENHRVLKDVVKLLEKYQIRYPRKQQHLSDFFEKLLTTGLKQEVGQYFTPPPITKFIVRSIPVKEMILQDANAQVAKLPAMIDYAAGSGHFITEAMEEYQNIINEINVERDIKYPIAKKEVASWQANPYNWAAKYVYGIEKDYRLVKVAKVGCYFYGDGVAQVIHGDGLDSFKTSKTYKGLLQDNANKPQFSLILSNPPYSVNDCKDDLEYIGAQNDFELYSHLTDKSKDIECLFVERTKHLLKDDGVAAIILPSSILNNTGIQTKTREIILQYFDIIAIVELGGNTFMTTNTNTVTLFLKRRNNQDTVKLKTYTDKFFTEFIDNSIIEIEKPVAKYIHSIWENISFEDYVSLLKKQPNQNIEKHEIYKEYRKKIKAKTEKEFWDKLIETEKDKLHYFLLAYYQKGIVLVKSGEKDAEKRFLGYYFSDRRGNEGMHPMQGGKTIDDCTQLYNVKDQNDFTKASSYIYNAFIGNKNLEIAENLKNNVSYIDLLDMLTFDRAEFQKEIKLAVKKKVKIESKYEQITLGEIEQLEFINGYAFKSSDFKHQITSEKDLPVLKIANINNNSTDFVNAEYHDTNGFNSKIVNKNDIAIALTGATVGKAGWITEKCLLNQRVLAIKNNDIAKFVSLFIFGNNFYDYAQNIAHGNAQGNLSPDEVKAFKVPLPSKEIQQKIVSEIEVLEKKENEAKEKIEKYKAKICDIMNNVKGENKKLRELCNYSDNRIDNILLTSGNYIGVDNMLQNTKGKTNSNFVPNSGTSTAYNLGDVLLSNIRPYLKKIWYADNNGGSSNDVLILQTATENINSKYLFYNLKQDKFFDYEMEGKKGVKMPRGDKQHILDYTIFVPSLSEQQKIVAEIEKIEIEIAKLEQQLAEIPQEKEAVLKKYL